MGGYAWVTLATNNSYSLGALVLAHSLKKSNTAHKLVVLITSAVSESMRNQLNTVFDVVKLVDVLDSKDEAHLALMQRPELGITFTKIHCWRLVEFDKCVFLDADTLVVRNCDELFEREEFSAAPDASWPDCFNSGVFVFKPSIDTFNKILQFAVENKSFDGGDQGLLNQFFSSWATEDIKKHLPFVYNLTSIGSYAYIPAFKHYGAETRIVHFIGTGKPWLQQLDIATKTVSPSSGYEHLAPLLQQWWDLFCEKVHPTLDKNLESSNEGMSHSPIEACSNSLPIALTDEPQTLRLIPCTPHREYVVLMHNLPFKTNDSSGESPKPPPVLRESETRREFIWTNDACAFQTPPKSVEKECEKCTVTVPMKVEDETKEEEIVEEPPPKDPFDFESFIPNENCIKSYLEQNVVTYQPFESQQELKPPNEPEPLPRFLTIPEDDRRQSGNVDPPIEKPIPKTEPITKETRKEEHPREVLTKSKSMPFLPLEKTPETPKPPRSIWKSQPDVNVDPNRKYSMPKLKPIIPKQNSKFILTKIPKITHYTEFLMSSDYKEPVNLPKDRIGFVATQLHTQKHKRNKTNGRAKFGPLPFIESPEMDKPACKKIRLEHSDDDLYDLTQCKRQSGNKPKHKVVHSKPIGNNLEEILSRLKEFSKDYQHYFGVAPQPRRRTVMCKNAVVQTSGEEECRMSEAFKTVRTTVCSWSRGTQTLGQRKEFRQFRSYVENQNETSQKGLLMISGKNVTTPSMKFNQEEDKRKGSDDIFKGKNIVGCKNIKNIDNRKLEISGMDSRSIDDVMKAKSDEVLVKLSELEIGKGEDCKNHTKLVAKDGSSRLKKIKDGVNVESSLVLKKQSLGHSECSVVKTPHKSDDFTKEVSQFNQNSFDVESLRVQIQQLGKEDESVVHSTAGRDVDDVTKEVNNPAETNDIGVDSSTVQDLHSRNEKEPNESDLIVESKQQGNDATAQNEIQESENSTDGVSVTEGGLVLHSKTEENQSSGDVIIPQKVSLQQLKTIESPAAGEKLSVGDVILPQNSGVLLQQQKTTESPTAERSHASDDAITGSGSSSGLSDEENKKRTGGSTSLPEPNHNDDVINSILPSNSDKANELEEKTFFENSSEPEDQSADDVINKSKFNLNRNTEKRSSVTVQSDDVTTYSENKEPEDVLTENKKIKNEEKVKKPEEILCVPDFETPRSSRVTSKTTEESEKSRKCRSSPKKIQKRFKNNSPDESIRDNSAGGKEERDGVKEIKDRSGIAGAIAQLSLQAGSEQTGESTAASAAHQEYLRRQNWETGNIDYMGRDSFDNIWSKICQTLESKEQEPIKTEAEAVTLSKVPEYIETLPGKPVSGPVEDDEIIFSKSDSKQSGLINISEEDEAGGENVKLSDILGEGKVGVKSGSLVSPPDAKSQPGGGDIKAEAKSVPVEMKAQLPGVPGDVKAQVPVVPVLKSEPLVPSPDVKSQLAAKEIKPQIPVAEAKSQPVTTEAKPQLPAADIKPQTPGVQAKPQPPTAEAKPQPPIAEAKPQTPTTEAKPQTPTAEAKPQPPIADIKPPTPGVQAKPQTPTAEAKPQPVATEAKPQPPIAEAKPQSPAADIKPQTPGVQAKPQTPTAEAKPQTPTTEAKPQTPTAEAKPQPPIADIKPPTPGVQAKPQTPTAEAKPQPPAADNKPQTPGVQAKPQPPTAEVKPQPATTEAKSQPPASEVKPQTPGVQAKPQTPTAEAKPQTPTAEAKPQTPTAEAKPQPPIADIKPLTPGVQAKPQTPTAEAKPQPVATEAKPQPPIAEAKPQTPTTEAKPQTPTAEAKPQPPTAEAKPQPVTTEAKPQPATSEAKPQTPTTEAKPETPTTEVKPQSPAADIKPQTPGVQAKPQTPTIEAKPQTPTAEAKPQTPTAEAKPQPVTTEAKPQSVTAEAKPQPAPAEAKPQPPTSEAKPQPPTAEAKPQPPTSEAKPQPPTAEAKPQSVTTEAKPQPAPAEAKPQPPTAEAKSKPSKGEIKPEPASTDIKPQLSTISADVTPQSDTSKSTDKPKTPQIPIQPTTESTGECKVVAIPSPPILPTESRRKGKKSKQKSQVQSEPIPLPPPDSPSSEQLVKTSRSDSLKDEGKQKKGVFTKILEMVGVKEKNGNEENKSMFYDAEGGEKEVGVEALEGMEDLKQEGVKEGEKTAGEIQPEVKESQKVEVKKPEKVQPVPKPERSSKDTQKSNRGSEKKRKSPSPKLTMPQTPETSITTPTPPPSQENPPRKNSALLKVEETIPETPPVTETSNVQTEIENIIGKAKTEVETLLQDKESSDMINTMKLIMGEEQEEVEELKVTTEEERKRHKGEVVSSKLSDQILKAIPPPRRKAISDATASTSAIPEQKSPQTAEGKTKPSKGSSIPVPPPRNKGKPQPPPSKGKGKK